MTMERYIRMFDGAVILASLLLAYVQSVLAVVDRVRRSRFVAVVINGLLSFGESPE